MNFECIVVYIGGIIVVCLGSEFGEIKEKVCVKLVVFVENGVDVVEILFC